MVKFSHTEGRMLINRFNFHNAPMFLMYYGGKLVFLSPVLGRDGLTRENLDSTMDACLVKAEVTTYYARMPHQNQLINEWLR